MENEISNKEILEAINEFSSKTDERFIKIEATMVTKDYLDEKINSMRGDIIGVLKKEDDKFQRLVLILKGRKVITLDDEKSVLSDGPFPKLYA